MYNVLVNLQSSRSHVLELSKRSEAIRLPFKPTSSMLAAGASAGGVTPDVAWRIYRAMLDAAAGEFSSAGLAT